MNLTLKSIRLICVVIFYFSIFSSNLLALDYFRDHYIIKKNNANIEEIQTNLKKCLESKSNNFKDRNPKERMALIYVNTLLDNLLFNNKDILNQFGSSPDKFCVDAGDIRISPFSNQGLGLIVIDLKFVSFILQEGWYIFDSYIVATLAHEIAHDLLKHQLTAYDKELEIYNTSSFKDKYKDINEYNITLGDDYPHPDEIFDIEMNVQKGIPLNDTQKRIPIEYVLKSDDLSHSEYQRIKDNSKKLDEESTEWNKFYKTHPDFIKMRQKQEIAADNLGLKLYLNTEFKPEDFGKHYIRSSNLIYYPSIPDIFRIISQGDNYITEGERARKEGRFEEFMESIKYEKPNKKHPSTFWRYWNARTQIESNNIDLDHGIQNNLYIKIDLSKSKKLAELKTFFSNFNNRSKEITNKQDPRYYIIDKLLNYKKRSSLSYTLEFIPSSANDVGILKDDNTILLRANDIFQLSLILTAPKQKNAECVLLFYLFGQDPYSSIKKAFL